jgi:hypothetical protein
MATTLARARDAMLVDPAPGRPTPLWPRLSELRHTLLLFEDAHHAIAAGGTTEATGDRLQILRRSRARRRGCLTTLSRYLDRMARIGGAGRSGPSGAPSSGKTSSAKLAAV